MPERKNSVAIVGAGLVGSLSAVYFSKRGWKVHLFDYRKDPRKVELEAHSLRSINLALSHRGIEALEKVGLKEIVLKNVIPMKGRMVHSLNGSLSSQKYGVFGECINSMDRNLLNKLLLNAAEEYQETEIHFERSVQNVDIDNGIVKVTHPNGSLETFKADLIVGADGAYSTVRKTLMRRTRFNYQQEYIEHGYMELCIPAKDGQYQMDPNHLHIWPRHTFMLIALPNLDKSFTVTLFMPFSTFEQLKSDLDILGFFKKEFPDAVPFLGEKNIISDFRNNPKGALMTVKCAPYNYKDKVVLLGDAAHAMVPFYGQGMNCGFEDCRLLDEILDEFSIQSNSTEGLETALDYYSTTRHPNAHAICDLAKDNYVEMRSSVVSCGYLMRRKMETTLSWLFPRWVTPLYSMVSFSSIPYAKAKTAASRQRWWITKGFSIIGVTSLLAGSVIASKFITKRISF